MVTIEVFSNWTVVEVIIALTGLFFLVAKPIIDNAKTTERLISTMEELSKDLKELELKNTETHGRMFNRIDESERRIENHEVRIKVVEGKVGE